MNAPDRETREVREWLRHSTPAPPDAERSVDEVMTTLFRSTQLRPRVSSLVNDMYSGAVSSGSGRITNDGGSWTAVSSGFAQPGKSAYHNATYALQLTGEGGYDGLSAMLLMTPVPGSHWDVEGIIFPGQLPEMPAAVDAS